MIYTAQSQQNSSVQIAAESPERAAAIYVRTLRYVLPTECVTVTDPAGHQTERAIDTARELNQAWESDI